MGLKKRINQQYRDTLDATVSAAAPLELPPEGWLRTARKALSMSGAQLARRLGVTRALVSNTERAELSGGVTLRTMQRMADAMGYQFVYGLVPRDSVEAMVWGRALQKAKAEVAAASVHMALEDQALSAEQQAKEVERLGKELMHDMPSTLWDEV